MATSITRRPSSPPPHPGVRLDEFVVEASTAAPHPNVPQQTAAKLMTPSLAMGLMGLAAGLVLAIVRADATSGGSAADVISRLQHVQAGATFLGFTGVFSAIVFAIARILGVFRTGGGRVQQATGGIVQTLRMPTTAKAMIGLMRWE